MPKNHLAPNTMEADKNKKSAFIESALFVASITAFYILILSLLSSAKDYRFR